MDIVVGLEMSSSTIRMARVEGENPDGMTVDAQELTVTAADESVTGAADEVVTALLSVHEGATEAGDRLCSIGVTWTDEVDVAALREALAARQVQNLVLVSAVLAAAALAQTVAQAAGYERIAMLFVEPDGATLGVVDAADGSITDVHKEPLHGADATAELAEMVAGLESLETRPEGLFLVGSGVDIAPIKPRLQTVTPLAVTAPQEPETALARGAALASANAPLFASSTAALAYAQDRGTGEVDHDAVAPGYFYVPDAPAGGQSGGEELAYSAVPDDEANALTEVMDTAEDDDERGRRRRPVLLVGSASAVVAVSALVAMEVALALGIRPGVALRPSPGHNLIAPAEQAPAPGPSRYIPQPGAVAAPHPLNPGPPPPAAPVPAPIPAPPPVAPPAPVLVPPPGVPEPAAAPPVPTPDSSSPPLNLPAPQPPAHAPELSPPTQVPVSQPPTHVPVWQPPTHPPVSHPPVHIPAPQPPAHAPEPQPPVNVPSPDAPPVRGLPGVQAPPVPGAPGLETPPVPGISGREAPPAPDIPPARGGESGPASSPGGDVGGHGSEGGGSDGGAGAGGHSSGGGEIGGGSVGGGSIGGGSSGGGSSGGGEVGGGSSGGGSTGENGGGGGHH
jgi:hypothetical protein